MIKKPEKSDILIEYIRKNIAKGYTRESLKWALIKQGNSRIEIEKAMKKVEEDMEKESVQAKARASMETINTPAAVEPIREEPKSFWRKFFSS